MGELSVGLSAIGEDNPEIFVGNLLGASLVLCVLVAPLLAITKSKVVIPQDFRGWKLLVGLALIGLPVFLVLDGSLSQLDGASAAGAFLVFMAVVSSLKSKTVEAKKELLPVFNWLFIRELLTMAGGIGLTLFASRFVVDQTLYFSLLLGFSPFLISLLVISLGTNLPELSLVVRAFLGKSSQVAFGDFIGSAVFNTFLMGILTLLYGKPIFLTNSYGVSLGFLVLGLVMFLIFARSKDTLSRLEGWMLFSLYILFLVVEIAIH